MNRSLVTLTGIGFLACFGVVVPATAPTAGAIDLPRTGGNNRDGVEVARGDDGDTITYTINETADTAAPSGAPVTPAAPDLSRVPVVASDGEPVLAGPPDQTLAPVVSEPAPVVSDEPVAAPAAAEEPPAAVAACADYATWYDAQVDYEAMGGPAAAPAIVGSLDPDADGVACEEIIPAY